MRQSGTRFRMITSLVDTNTEAAVWTERFDGIIDDIFDVQDAIIAKVAAAIEPRLIDLEADRAHRQRPANPTAYDCFLRGLAHFYSDTQESVAVSLQLMRIAMIADPTYAPPHALQLNVLYIASITDRAPIATATSRRPHASPTRLLQKTRAIQRSWCLQPTFFLTPGMTT